MNKFSHNQAGFTLIEILLYVAVSAVIITAIFAFIAFMWQSKAKTIAIMEVEEQGREIMEIINRDIRAADSILSPVAQTNASSLSLSGANSQVYSLSTGVLYRSLNGAANEALHNTQVTLSNLVFENLSLSGTPGIIQTSFDLKYNNPDNRNEYNYQQSFVGSAALRP